MDNSLKVRIPSKEKLAEAIRKGKVKGDVLHASSISASTEELQKFVADLGDSLFDTEWEYKRVPKEDGKYKASGTILRQAAEVESKL